MTAHLRAVSDLIGEPLAAALCDRFAGRQVYVPKSPRPDSTLVLVVGHGPAARICAAFGEQYLAFPSRHSLETRGRRAEVVRDLRSGRSVSEVARLYGLTPRYVRKIRSSEGIP